jgi:uncharacterized protein (DUF433 family)
MTTTVALPQAEPAEQRTEHPHVARVDGVPTLHGTRLPVRLVAQMYRAGDTVDDILRTYPHLAAAAVHDAISYYLDHRAEMEQEIAAHRIEAALARTGAQMDERGFITFPQPSANG